MDEHALGCGTNTDLNSNNGIVVEHFSYTWIFVLMGLLHPIAYLLTRSLVCGPISSAAPNVPQTQLR